ncbi:MAG: c-type cytochrome [Caulobacteraceae bacterium]|nr:c-type cytochrome [Caulobacteraceae bacterium]
MPSSLKFLAIYLAAGFLAAAASLVVINREDQAAANATARALTGGDPHKGKLAAGRYGCGACHQLGLVKGVEGKVGPPLTGIAKRAELAGRLQNDPQSLIRWIRFPQEVVPGNGMPDQGIREADARDIAAYLYSLR